MICSHLIQIFLGRYIPDPYDLYELYDLYDLYDLAHIGGWGSYNLHGPLEDMLPGLDLYYTDPALNLITAGEDLDDLGRDLSDDLSDLSDLDRDLSDLSDFEVISRP